MKSENKSSSELFGCCFGGIFLKKFHLSSQEVIAAGDKQKLDDDLVVEATETPRGEERPPTDPPPYSLHDDKSHANGRGLDILNYPGNNKPPTDRPQISSGGILGERYVHDHDTDTTYLLGRLLGKGGFAKCFELKDTKTQKVFAGKIISKNKLTKPRQKEKIVYEISLHSSLSSQHVVNFHNSFEDDSNVYIVLEFCSRKSLVHVLKTRQRLTEAEVRYYVVQMLDGIRYIHSQNIVHRDLKLGNMLLNENMEVKIADFGLATRIEHPGEKKMTVCGTPNYIAPEVLHKKGHSYEVDIWATGCIMYALICGRPPFETHSLKDTYLRISANRFHVPSYVSSAARRLICKLLHPDPERRPSLNEITADEFFTSFFTPRYLPTSCCEVEPKFGSSALQGKADDGKISKRKPNKPREEKTAQNVLTVQHLPQSIKGSKNCPKVPFEPEADANLKVDIQMKRSLSAPHSRPPSRHHGKKVTPKSQPPSCTEAAGSLVPKNLERYCKSIKMLEFNKDSNVGKKLIEFGQHVFQSSAKNLPENAVGISRFSAIRLYRALSHCLEIMPSDSYPNPTSDIHLLWVTKWVDYSNKYGFGFQLSDLSVGILFNDTTRMVLSPDGRSLTYNDLSNQTFVYATNSAPKEHRKKVTLLLYFSQYMEEHLIHGADLIRSQEAKEKELLELRNAQDCSDVANVFMRKWFRTDKAIVMHLSNGTLQVNFFDDHTKLILSVEDQDYLATYINSRRQSTSYRLLSITNFGCEEKISDCLKYARKMLEGVINLGGETV